ncbi:MAG TPA: rod shape-determining protein MreC [Chloroflexota bacterium]|jgi:rod shape-determining protein MreC|nr:rod shape-determining protein MreC [Chloroflexota bacterium]
MRVQRLIRWVSLFLIGAFGLLALDTLQMMGRYQKAGEALVAPFSWAASVVGGDAAGTWSSIAAIGTLEQENRALRAENAALKEQNVQLQASGQDLGILRQLLSYKQAHPEHVYHPAAVIARGTNNLEAMLTLDQGSADGLRIGMAVVDAGGLVGQIIRLAPHAAVVTPIDNGASAVAAYVAVPGGNEKSDPTGVVQYEPGAGLLLRFVQATAPLQKEDWVLTSGLGGTFARGLPLGRIGDVRQRPVDLFQMTSILPAADLHNDRQVLVVTDFVPQPLPTPAP